MQTSPPQFVFIAGLHRSGTSLLQRLLGAHPRISAFRDTGVPEDEGQHLQSVYPPARAFGGPGRFGFHPDAYMDESHPLVTPENQRRLVAEWSRYWERGAEVLLEKSPPNLIRTRFFQALFPGASFITLLRHPVAVACATKKWAKDQGLERLVEHWLVCHEAFARDRSFLHRVLTLHYEELVGSPQAVLNRVWEFLGLDPIPVEEGVRQGVNEEYFNAWDQRCRSLVSGWTLRRAVKRLEPRVRQFGYSLYEQERLPVPVASD